MYRPTWDEMFTYLLENDSCRINGQGWHIENSHRFLSKYKVMIECHDPEVRGKNIHCLRLKSSLHRAYKSHKAGLIEANDTKHKKFFGVGSR
tara:strand:+ start:12390 stop:12665 length:276 start_codon:yes stop_codon:yes gene_type:complete